MIPEKRIKDRTTTLVMDYDAFMLDQMKKHLLALFVTLPVLAQVPRPSLKDISTEENKSFPQIYDHATKLIKTTVENNNFYYHFLVGANQKEFDFALPKVKAQILKSICARKTERTILKEHKANIVYRYESDKGMSLGEFMVKPQHCPK